MNRLNNYQQSIDILVPIQANLSSTSITGYEAKEYLVPSGSDVINGWHHFFLPISNGNTSNLVQFTNYVLDK